MVRARLQSVHNEFRKQIVTGITAAFAFLIALVWREPIESGVRAVMASLGFGIEGGLLHKIVTALLVTGIAAIALVLLSRWATENN